MRSGIAVLAILLGGTLSVMFVGSAQAADPDPRARTPEQVMEHHFAVYGARDVDALVNDYADDAEYITAAGVKHGKAEIRAVYAQMFKPRPGAAGREQDRQFLKKYFTSDVAWCIWATNVGKPNEVRGVVTFVVRRGKIVLQTIGTVNVHAAAPVTP